MKIEYAHAKHAELIASFQIKMALETEDLELDKGKVQAGVKAVFDDPSKGRYLVALDNNKVIGSLLTIPEWSDWRNSYVLWIHSVYILAEYRGQKIYSKMYHFLKEKVDHGEIAGLRLYVDKTNKKAQKVYAALEMNNDHYELYEYLPY